MNAEALKQYILAIREKRWQDAQDIIDKETKPQKEKPQNERKN